MPRFSQITVPILREFGIEILIGSPERAFDSSRVSVKKALRNRMGPPKPRAGHNPLPEDFEADPLTSIRHRAEKSQPFTIYHAVLERPSLAGKFIHSYSVTLYIIVC
jgi:hypothetical protein